MESYLLHKPRKESGSLYDEIKEKLNSIENNDVFVL